jgi:hypothetical protein
MIMHRARSRSRSLRVCFYLPPLLAVLASPALVAGGCNLLVEEQLSDKPETMDETGRLDGQGGDQGSRRENSSSASGGGGSGGNAMSASSSAGTSSSVASSSSSSGGESSSGSGGLTCPPHRADCDGNADNGCEVHLKNDSDNCGECGHACQSGDHCSNGECG